MIGKEGKASVEFVEVAMHRSRLDAASAAPIISMQPFCQCFGTNPTFHTVEDAPVVYDGRQGSSHFLSR